MRDAERRKKEEVDYYKEGVSATDGKAASSRCWYIRTRSNKSCLKTKL